MFIHTQRRIIALLFPLLLIALFVLPFTTATADDKGKEKPKEEKHQTGPNKEGNFLTGSNEKEKHRKGPKDEEPQIWVELKIYDGNISMNVDGPGVSVSRDWAVFSVRSNSRVSVDVRPDSYLRTKDGLTLGKATTHKGDAIGYELLVRPWHPKRGHHRYHSPLHYRNINHWRLIGLGAIAAGNYTQNRTMAKPGQYQGKVLVTASVEN